MPPRSNEAIWTKPLIASISLSLFVAVLGVAWWTGDKQSLGMLTGCVVSNLTIVIGFYFGSSAGSERKTDILAQPPKP